MAGNNNLRVVRLITRLGAEHKRKTLICVHFKRLDLKSAAEPQRLNNSQA